MMMKYCKGFMRIRNFMLLGIILLLVLPRILTPVPALLGSVFQEILPRDHVQHQAAVMDTALQDTAAAHLKWRDAGWQQAMRNKIGHDAIGLSITDAAGRAIFATGPVGTSGQAARQAVVVDGARDIGTVRIYASRRGAVFHTIFTLLITVGVVLMIWLQMGRMVVGPLEAMSAAARKIAGGDLDFKLPGSNVVEVAEVGRALQALGEGLQKSVTRQSELEQERRYYIGAIAHDLRTPLFALRGFLSRLQTGLAESPEKAVRYLEICRQKAELLERLVSDLFSYVKSDMLEETVHRELMDLTPFAAGLANDFRQLAASKGIGISESVPDTPCLIEADAHMLERAVGNLLENALRYTPKGGRIEVALAKQESVAELTVSDTGPGIPAMSLPHLFEPFYRADSSRNTETGGTGLGLTIARRIVQVHGGELTAGNRPEGGAYFKVLLPLQKQG